MIRDSVYLLQKLDCNCNDCKFMIRDLEKHKQSSALHYTWQFDYFNVLKAKIIEKAKQWEEKGELKKAEYLFKEVKAMKFQFDKSTAVINFGRCSKFNKDVSFIPNVCQIETQECFVHRKDSV